MLGISYDTPDKNRHFQQKFEFPYDLLSDEDAAVSAAYGAKVDGKATPARVSVLIGADGRIAKAYDTVKPADHPAEVLADLASMGG